MLLNIEERRLLRKGRKQVSESMIRDFGYSPMYEKKKQDVRGEIDKLNLLPFLIGRAAREYLAE